MNTKDIVLIPFRLGKAYFALLKIWLSDLEKKLSHLEEIVEELEKEPYERNT
jgi:hypothetical protein